MNSTFYSWDDFVANYGKEMRLAEDVYNSMKKHGLKDFTYAKFDFHFVSDEKYKLEALNQYLQEHYNYEYKSLTKFDCIYDLTGLTNDIPITQENLLYWALDMAKRGMEFDCQFDGYGSAPDNKKPIMPCFSEDQEDIYFDKAMQLYNLGDLSGSFFNLSLVININPYDPNAYYSRAIVRNELYTWKSALSDYDKAIELAPAFVDAIVNRGTIKDEHGDYCGAIEDYNKAIALDANNSMAYFNRGNSNYNMGNRKTACADWNKALQLGDDSALERIMENCRECK